MICFLIEDLWPSRDRAEGEVEPEWVMDERDHFNKHRDKDGDNKLNKVNTQISVQQPRLWYLHVYCHVWELILGTLLYAFGIFFCRYTFIIVPYFLFL